MYSVSLGLAYYDPPLKLSGTDAARGRVPDGPVVWPVRTPPAQVTLRAGVKTNTFSAWALAVE